MSLWYKFLKLKTWQKLGLGIAILSIFRIFAYHNFIIMDVQAQSSTKGFYKFFDNETSLQIQDSTIKTSGMFASNFISQEDLNSIANNNMYQVPTITAIDSTNDTFAGYSSSRATVNQDYTYTFGTSINDIYLTSLAIDSWSYHGLRIRPLKKNHTYTLAFTIFKTGGEFDSSIYSNNDFNISGTYCRQQSVSSGITDCYSLSNKFDVVEIGYFNPDNQDIYTNNHYLYLYVTIELNDNFPSSVSNNTWRLDSLTIDLNNPVYSAGDSVDMTSFKYFMKSTGDDSTFGIKLVQIMEDVDTYLVDNENYSIITGQNINMTEYDQCDNLDIACHIRNLVKGIKSFTANIMHSIYALFSKIFIPDFSRLMNHINSSRNLLTSKVPDIQEVMDYGEYFVTRLQNVQPVHTISFSGVKLPGYNTYIIPAFTYDFDSIINDSAFSGYYSLARAVLIVLLSIGWGLFSIRVIVSMLHDTSALKGD